MSCWTEPRISPEPQHSRLWPCQHPGASESKVPRSQGAASRAWHSLTSFPHPTHNRAQKWSLTEVFISEGYILKNLNPLPFLPWLQVLPESWSPEAKVLQSKAKNQRRAEELAVVGAWCWLLFGAGVPVCWLLLRTQLLCLVSRFGFCLPMWKNPSTDPADAQNSLLQINMTQDESQFRKRELSLLTALLTGCLRQDGRKRANFLQKAK